MRLLVVILRTKRGGEGDTAAVTGGNNLKDFKVRGGWKEGRKEEKSQVQSDGGHRSARSRLLPLTASFISRRRCDKIVHVACSK